ncbi:MAG: ABC transporter permease [Verrucomicrobiota bacterium]
MDRASVKDLMPAPPSAVQALVQLAGREFIRVGRSITGLGAFTVATFLVMVTRFRVGYRVVYPQVLQQIHRTGIRLLPMVIFVSLVLGWVVIGQTVSLLTRVRAQDLVGTVMITAIVRELGPLVTALLVLSRTGSSTVIELGTARAMGEIETLEVLGIDPLHYLVVPRMIGVVLSTFTLTVFLVITSLIGGYVFIFLQDVPLMPGEYFRQLASALTYLDFVMLAFKTVVFGTYIAATTCYQGLSHPVALDQIASAANRAVIQGVVGCALLDVLFILGFLLF